MVDIRFLCPECSRRLSIDMYAAACLVECPHCESRIRPWNSELMDLAFACPTCAVILLVDASLAGEVFTCTECRSRVRAPVDSTSMPELLSAAKDRPAVKAGRDTARTVRLSEEEIEFLMGVGETADAAPAGARGIQAGTGSR